MPLPLAIHFGKAQEAHGTIEAKGERMRLDSAADETIERGARSRLFCALGENGVG